MQAEKKQFQVQLFHGVEHGFALGGDINNLYERAYSDMIIRTEQKLTCDRVYQGTEFEGYC